MATSCHGDTPDKINDLGSFEAAEVKTKAKNPADKVAAGDHSAVTGSAVTGSAEDVLGPSRDEDQDAVLDEILASEGRVLSTAEVTGRVAEYLPPGPGLASG